MQLANNNQKLRLFLSLKLDLKKRLRRERKRGGRGLSFSVSGYLANESEGQKLETFAGLMFKDSGGACGRRATLSSTNHGVCVCDRCTWRVGGFYVFIYICEWLDMEKKV